MNLHLLALRQLEDYDCRNPGTMFADLDFPISLPQAYQLQLAVAQLREARGEGIAGYKVGCVSPAMQKQLNVDHPVFGHLFQSELFSSGVQLDASRYCNLSIEGEFAVRLACDVPSPEWLRDHMDEAIAAWFPVIELHNYVFRRSPPTAVELVANNAIHAGVVLPAQETRHAADGIEVSINDCLKGSSTARDFTSLLHLAGSGWILKRGQLILTGTTLPLYPVVPGDRITVRSAGYCVEATISVPEKT